MEETVEKRPLGKPLGIISPTVETRGGDEASARELLLVVLAWDSPSGSVSAGEAQRHLGPNVPSRVHVSTSRGGVSPSQCEQVAYEGPGIFWCQQKKDEQGGRGDKARSRLQQRVAPGPPRCPHHPQRSTAHTPNGWLGGRRAASRRLLAVSSPSAVANALQGKPDW